MVDSTTAALLFSAGWLLGLLTEYVLHYAMHARPMHFHLHHHKEFFYLPARNVAINTADPRMNIKYFLILGVVLLPLAYKVGWLPVLLFWSGMFWHLVIVYELAHALLHYDDLLPRFLRRARIYRWWKGCHFEHHYHSPTGNYCVTFPILDVFFRSYIHPREDYDAPAPRAVEAVKGLTIAELAQPIIASATTAPDSAGKPAATSPHTV
jgi:hypothetical protein